MSYQSVLMLCLSFLVLGSTAQEAPTKSIANIVSDLLQVADPVPSIKEWTIDWQADLGDETRAALTPLHQAIDLTKLMEDILIDDGHDEDSMEDLSSRNSMMMGRSSCSCCRSMNMGMGGGAGVAVVRPEYNTLVHSIMERFVSDLKQLAFEPMSVCLRRRSVRETAYLFQQNQFMAPNFQRSLDNEQEAVDRNGKNQHELWSMNQWNPSRIRASLSGLGTLKRSGDVRALMQPLGGGTLLKVDLVAGPVHLKVPSMSRTATIDQLPGEMILTLHPRQGLILHSFRFQRPSEIRTNEEQLPELSVGVRPSFSFASAGSTEAAVTQQLRRAIRMILSSP